MQRVAMGEIGLTLKEFDSLTPEEFNEVMAGYRAKHEKQLDNQLWQTRYLAATVLNASPKVKKTVKPRDLFRLPGEQKKVAEKRVTMTPQQLQENIRKLNERAQKK